MILQRRPIDVNASIGCVDREELLFDTTTQLLERANTLRPHAGAIIRHAVSSPLLAAGESHPTFIKVISEAADAWWQGAQGRLAPHKDATYDIDWSKEAQVIEGDSEGHYDQKVGAGGKPAFGPLTVGLVLEGPVQYKLAVKRANPFVVPDMVFNPMMAEAEGEPPRRTHSITNALPGDIVMFTNTPPTWHEVQAQDDQKLTANYFSNFVQAESLR